MKAILIAAAGSLLAAAAVPAAALTPQSQTQPHTPPAQSHAPAPHMTPAAPPSQKMAPRPPAHEGTGPRPYQVEAGGMHDEMRGDMRYGRWDDAWGRRPPAPPAHFTRHEDWHRHVHACQQRYKSYNPRTDMFMARRNHAQRCTL